MTEIDYYPVAATMAVVCLVYVWWSERRLKRWRQQAAETLQFWRAYAADQEAQARGWEVKAHAAAQGWREAVTGWRTAVKHIRDIGGRVH